MAAVQRGQLLGFGALVLMLSTVVILAVIGQPWVAGIVGGGLAVTVAIFVTGQYRPAQVRVSDAATQGDAPRAADYLGSGLDIRD